MTRSRRKVDKIFAEPIDGISLRHWSILLEVILARWPELVNMDSSEQIIARLGWDARMSGVEGVKPRHIRLAFAAINATRRHDSRSTT